ncbi:MAG TPA: His/Gly/Thr/Pro-type tRNA ligase C-terminal domain-containing protein, partial [Candidatus Binatus sp.]|nr:His/Gly/Thr/Pro-type tRNA ligase C-terminal domain-containing protein [Candidatus Binatus sp.]
NTTRSFFEEHKDVFVKLAAVEKKPILINFVPEGHYYWVLNVEYNIIDDLDRPREIGTFQIDIGNAKRFGINYDDEKGHKQYPVIIHTAVLGGLERYLFTLLDSAIRLEKQGKKPMLPVWISPTQTRVIPVGQQFMDEARRLVDKLQDSGVRADLDERDDTVQSRVREAELSWVPYILIFGGKEAKSEKLSVRAREDGKDYSLSFDEFVKLVHSKTKSYPYRELNIPKLVSQRPGYKRV